MNDRVKACRERQRLARAEVIAELARELPAKVHAEALASLGPSALDRLQWALTEASALHGGVTRAARKQLDAYFTPPPVAAAVTSRIAAVVGGDRVHGPVGGDWRILEPSAGRGAFVRAARTSWPLAQVVAVDIKLRKPLRETPALLIQGDFLRYSPPRPFHLVLGNPPFNAAEEHVRHALELLAPGGHLAMILGLGFLAGVDRAQGLWSGPGARYFAAITPRPSFLEDGTDRVDYGLFIWERGFTGIPEWGKPIEWKAPPASSPAAALRGAA